MCLHIVGLITIYIGSKLIINNDKRYTKYPKNIKINDSSASAKYPKDELTGKSKDIATEIEPISNSFDTNICEGSDFRKSDTNYLLKDLIKGEKDNLSNLLKGKIEAANIEGLIDKTVSGIVELKDDIMSMNEPEVYGPTTVENLRKRNIVKNEKFDETKKPFSTSDASSVDNFLQKSKKEIDAIKKEATVVLSLSNANTSNVPYTI